MNPHDLRKDGKQCRITTDLAGSQNRCVNATPKARGLCGVAFSLGDDPNPILPGTRGTVNVVDDIATVHCTFDNGRSFGICYGEDSFRALTAEELAEESECEEMDQVGGMHL